VRDNVWFTYKARIQAHQRLSRNDFHSQVILVWYALLSTILAITAIRYPKVLGDDTDLTSAALSVVLLVVSMLVTNRDFRGRAIEMRRNYLALQGLYFSATPSTVLTPTEIQKYDDLLQSVENHSEMDDKVFRVLHRGSLQTRNPTRMEWVEVHLHIALRCLVLTALYVAPIALMLLLAEPQ
jgi:hypothetical protein